MTTYRIATPDGVITYAAATDVQIALAGQILSAASAAGPSAEQFLRPVVSIGPQSPAYFTATLTAPFAFNLYNDLLIGSAQVPVARILLQNATSYETGQTSLSTVVVSDGSTSTVINDNPGGALLAAGGAAQGPNGQTFEGLAGANQFITGTGGRDAVLLDGVVNSLTSNGNDVVLVGGPSTITAGTGGADAVAMTAGTTLAFINQSARATVDSISGAANGIVLLAGPGNTSVTAGVGPEFFFVDTSAGNTTLNANASPNAAFTFIRNQAASSANIQVNNVATGDAIVVHGYTGYTIQAAPAGGSTLSLSDGSQITFNNLAATTLQQTVRSA